MKTISPKKMLLLFGFLAMAGLAVLPVQAQSNQMASANKAYVKCLVSAFNQQAGQQKVTKASLTNACKAQEKAYFDAVYNQNPSLEGRFKNNNARAAIRRIKAKTFKAFGI